MHPKEKYIRDFQTLFPKAIITCSEYEENNIIFYHNVALDYLNETDRRYIEHINQEMIDSGYVHQLLYIGEEKNDVN